MKKKVFFVLSSLRAGGAERVFWLLTQYFDRNTYDVTLVLLDMKQPFFSTDLPGIRIVDLKSIRSSRSFWKLFRLVRKEKPHVIYSTAPQINILVAFIGLFNRSVILIGREYCILDELQQYITWKGRLLSSMVSLLYRKFNFIVCQSEEMRLSLMNKYMLDASKLVVIPNPIIPTAVLNHSVSAKDRKKLIAVGRLAKEKGYDRLLQILKLLPEEYELTIAGNGPLRNQLLSLTRELNLSDRVNFVGQVHHVTKLIAGHDLLVLGSYTEGFPNVVVEALSVGTPVVTFRVGGVSQVVSNDFNGYIVPQNELEQFRDSVIRACERKWDASILQKDAIARFGIHEVTGKYAELIHRSYQPAI